MAASGGTGRGPAAGRLSSDVPAGFAVLEYRRQSPSIICLWWNARPEPAPHGRSASLAVSARVRTILPSSRLISPLAAMRASVR